MRLIAPNGAAVDACEQAAERLLAAGFRKEEAPKEAPKEAKTRRKSRKKD